MIKVVFFLFLIFEIQISYSQEDSTSIRIFNERVDSVKSPHFFLTINFISNSINPICIISETSVSEFYCGLDGALGIHVQKLEDSCFKDVGIDCNPTYPPKVTRTKQMKRGDTASYKFDIGAFFYRKNIGNKIYRFNGIYRIKIYHRFITDRNTSSVTSSKWIYLTFE